MWQLRREEGKIKLYYHRNVKHVGIKTQQILSVLNYIIRSVKFSPLP